MDGLSARWYWNATLYFYIVLILLQNQSSFCMTTSSSRLILQKFVAHYNMATLVVFGCWHKTDELSLMKYMAQKQVFIKIFNLNNEDISLHTLYTEHKPMAVALNMQCQGADEVIKKASRENFFRQLHYWLLLDSEYAAIKETNIKKSLSQLNIVLDSHVFIVYQGTKIIIQSAYRIKTKEPLIITTPYEWDAEMPFPFLGHRDNFGGRNLTAGLIVIEDSWEHFLDLRYRHLNTMSKLSYVLTSYLAEMLNFRMQLIFTDTWGFPINNSKVYSGIVGLLQNHTADIGATTLFIKPARLDYVSYAAEAFPFIGAMMFMQPSLSEISVLYLLPFSNSVWATIVALMAILTIAFLYSSHWEQKVTSSASLNWGETVINTIGIVCQQGSPRQPETVPSRIIFLCLLLLSLFLVASYSAIIVSLLQMSSSAINTLTELLDSSFQLSMKNITYSVNYINDTNDPAVKQLFERLYSQPYDKTFISEEEGIANVRKGFHAFQGDANAYKVISDTFEEHEKCRYKEIIVFVTNVFAFPVQKHSPLKELIARKARWLREVGFTDREYRRWFNQKPKCNNNLKSFVSVRIQDFYPALLVLVYGLIASFCILCFELLYYSIQEARQSHIKHFSKSLTKFKGTYPPLHIKVGWYK